MLMYELELYSLTAFVIAMQLLQISENTGLIV